MANEPQRSEISKAKSPSVFDQFADEPISETLNARHRFTPTLCGESIAKHKVCIIRRCNHKIDIIQVIAAIGIAKQNPGDTSRNACQSAPARLSVSAVRLPSTSAPAARARFAVPSTLPLSMTRIRDKPRHCKFQTTSATVASSFKAGMTTRQASRSE